MIAQSIGRAPTMKTTDQLRAERRDRTAARRALVDQIIGNVCTAALCVAFVIVMIAG